MCPHSIVRSMKAIVLAAATLFFTFAVVATSANANAVDALNPNTEQYINAQLLQVAQASR